MKRSHAERFNLFIALFGYALLAVVIGRFYTYKMKKLTYLEQKIIDVIAETHPYTTSEVEMVYRRCMSFDNTIKILEESQAYAVDLTY
jgi:hypothetical protein